jgi:hypothetical protein
MNIASSSYLNWKSTAALFLCSVFWSSFLSGQDTTPPELISLTFSPTQVNVANSDQIVNLEIRMTDDLSGVDFIRIFFRSPAPGQAIIPNIVQGVGWGCSLRVLDHTQPLKKIPCALTRSQALELLLKN